MYKGEKGVIDNHLLLVKKGLRPSNKVDIKMKREFNGPISPFIYKVKNKKCKKGFSYYFIYHKVVLKTCVDLEKLKKFRDDWMKK